MLWGCAWVSRVWAWPRALPSAAHTDKMAWVSTWVLAGAVTVCSFSSSVVVLTLSVMLLGVDGWWAWASISPILFLVSLLNVYFIHLKLDPCVPSLLYLPMLYVCVYHLTFFFGIPWWITLLHQRTCSIVSTFSHLIGFKMTCCF